MRGNFHLWVSAIVTKVNAFVLVSKKRRRLRVKVDFLTSSSARMGLDSMNVLKQNDLDLEWFLTWVCHLLYPEKRVSELMS